MTVSTAFLILAIIALVVVTFLLVLALFEPGLDYKIEGQPDVTLDSPEFCRVLEALTDAKLHRGNHVEVLTNGEIYYERELEAIRQAKHSINLEAYIFRKGDVGARFVEALTERTRAGCQVRLVLDAIGSFTTWESFLKPLRDAGGRVAWYHPLRHWYTLARVNNRTHRELIIVDGRTGFVGGSGFADHWLHSTDEDPRWRDTMVEVTGEAVAGLQATFAENWLEASGEILSGAEFFPATEARPASDDPTTELPALVINSSPSAGRSTHARILYQMLFAAARQEILITTPYFIPDRSSRHELTRASGERGVRVRIIVPNEHIDHSIVRGTSRRLFGELLRAGAEIHEYQPSMIHTKSLVVDNLWSVVGSTNMDNRSFGLNDEVNLAARDATLAARLAGDFARDLAASRQVTLPEWKNRSLKERGFEQVGRLLERQQ